MSGAASSTVVSNVRGRARAHKARLEAQLDQERPSRSERLAATDDEMRQLELNREALQQSLGTTQDELQRLHDTRNAERQSYERAQLTSASELQRLSAEYDQARETLEQVRAAFQRPRARLESAGHRARQARTGARRTRRAAERAGGQTARPLSTQLKGRSRRPGRGSAWRSKPAAATSPSFSASSTRFARSWMSPQPSARRCKTTPTGCRSCRGTSTTVRGNIARSSSARRTACAGSLQTARSPHVNRSLVRLLGYRTRRRTADGGFRDHGVRICGRYALADRALPQHGDDGNGRDDVEEQRSRPRRRPAAGRARAPIESIEIVAEDITNLRAVEDQLRRAQRMEAVGRLASEVAVTCDNLLRDVTQDGEQWLAAIGSDTDPAASGRAAAR